MGDTTTAANESLMQPDATLQVATSASDQTYYECGAGRKLFFSFAFVLLLPFYVSLPVMLFQRLSKGLWVDTWQLIALAVLFTALMILIIFELIFSLRAEVDIGENSIAFTLPSGGGGTLPWLAYETRNIAYEGIDHVETRCEVFGGRYAPMMMRTVRLILKNGETVKLGRTNEQDDDPKFPFPKIAEQIAMRVGREIVDRGNIRHEFHRLVLGNITNAKCEVDLEITELNGKHNTFITFLSASLVVLLVLGIVGDFVLETADHGERARSTVVSR